MASILIEKDAKRFKATITETDNVDMCRMLAYLQMQVGLTLWQNGMEIEDVKSTMREVWDAGIEELDTQRRKLMREDVEAVEAMLPGTEKYREEHKNRLDIRMIMGLHSAGWTNREIASEMKTLEGHIDYIIKREAAANA